MGLKGFVKSPAAAVGLAARGTPSSIQAATSSPAAAGVDGNIFADKRKRSTVLSPAPAYPAARTTLGSGIK